MSATPHIAVLGAGVTGVTSAYALQNQGFQVTLVDRHRYPAMETSYANGGQLSASNAEVWTHHSTLLKGLAWMLKKDAPLALNLAPSWHKYSWLAEFIANVPRYRQHTVATAKLALAARRHLLAIAERENLDFDIEQRGILHFYRDAKSFRHAARVSELLAAAGLAREAVSAADIRAIEPTLEGDFYGGFYTRCDASGDIHKFTRGLATACERRGARGLYGREITALRHDHRSGGYTLTLADGEQHLFDGVVVCAGVGSRSLARMLGDRVNIYPVKGYSITVRLRDTASKAAAPRVSLLDDATKIVASRLGEDRFRVAGTAEFSGYNYDIRAERVRPLLNWVETLFPGVATDDVKPWAGLRPMTPSMLPKVGAGRRLGVFYNTGHGHLGWTLAAATSELLAAAAAKQMLSQRPRSTLVGRAA